MSAFLWEIGCEEIPAGMLPDAIAALAGRLTAALEAAGLNDAGAMQVETHGTPRRLVASVTGLAARQADITEERRGPPLERSFDADGRPTPAAEGFARSCGVAVADLQRLETAKGRYLAHTLKKAGAATGEVLPGIMLEILTGFPWPKAMRWSDGEMRFVRPIGWMVALLDGAVVPFVTPDGLAAGDRTRGHRFMAPGPFPVSGWADYRAALRSGRVELDLAERRRRIREGTMACAARAGGEAVIPEGLLTENAGLTEWPVPLLGRFDAKYLQIPAEVLSTSMKYHQKFFPIADAQGALLPCFVAVANLETADGGQGLIRGFERVLRARLEDAAFYWAEDRKVALDARLEALKSVVFQARLGTLFEKAVRLERLAGEIAPRLEPVPDAAAVARAARLCKCDLVTGMVGEFPELQGVMGGYYLSATGGAADAEAAAAIREHYRPQGATDAVPETTIGTVVALADKLDTLVGCFSINLAPSGAKDPFALRRAALGVIRMLLAGPGIRLPLQTVLSRAHAAYPREIPQCDAGETVAALLDFFYGRLKAHLKAEGYDHDLIDAVQALGLDDLFDAVSRVRALAGFKEMAAYQALVAANKRIVNILDKSAGGAAGVGVVDPARFADAAERALWQALSGCSEEVARRVAAAAYGDALATLAGLRPEIDRFFDQVLVMDPDSGIRANRLALLATVRDLFRQVADVSRLVLPE